MTLPRPNSTSSIRSQTAATSLSALASSSRPISLPSDGCISANSPASLGPSGYSPCKEKRTTVFRVLAGCLAAGVLATDFSAVFSAVLAGFSAILAVFSAGLVVLSAAFPPGLVAKVSSSNSSPFFSGFALSASAFLRGAFLSAADLPVGFLSSDLAFFAALTVPSASAKAAGVAEENRNAIATIHAVKIAAP